MVDVCSGPAWLLHIIPNATRIIIITTTILYTRYVSYAGVNMRGV